MTAFVSKPSPRAPWIVICVAAVFVLALHPSGAARAQGGGKPSAVTASVMQKGKGGFESVGFFEYTGKPGSTMEGRLKIATSATRPTHVAVQPVVAMTAQTLGVVYAPVGSQASGNASWIELSRDDVTVTRSHPVTVDVKVTVPPGTGPGDYVAGLSIFDKSQKPSQAQVQRGFTVKQLERTVIASVTTVPGARDASLAFTGAEGKSGARGATFVVGAENDGNVLVENVTGSATVTDPSGKPVAQLQLGPGGFVPGTSIGIPLVAQGLQPSAGEKFEVNADLVYGGRKATLDTTVTFGEAAAKQQKRYSGNQSQGGGGIPWWVWVLIAVAACAAVGLIVLLVRRRRASRRLLSAQDVLATLETELERSSIDGRPLSVVAAWIGGEADAEKAGRAMRARLRGRGVVGNLGAGWIAAVLPDTGPAAASGAAEDLARELVLVEGVDRGALRLGASTSDAAVTSAHELLNRATESAGA